MERKETVEMDTSEERRSRANETRDQGVRQFSRESILGKRKMLWVTEVWDVEDEHRAMIG